MGLDKDFQDFWREVVTNFEEGYEDSVSSSNNRGYVWLPAEGLVEEITQHLNVFCWPNIYVVNTEDQI